MIAKSRPTKSWPWQVQSKTYQEDQVPLLRNKNGRDNKAKCEDFCLYCCVGSAFIIVLIGLLSFLRCFIFVNTVSYPILSIDEASIIQGYNLTADNHLNATFDFVVKAKNPNTYPKYSMYYEFMEIKVYHGRRSQVVGYNGVYPFLQRAGNVTWLRFGGVASNMPLIESLGEVDLGIEIKGKFQFKLGSFYIEEHYLDARCVPIVVYFDSTRGFRRVNCDLVFKN